MKKDLLIILLLVLPAFAPLLRVGYFPMHDDLQTMRLLEMSKCITDGQIPCRWVPDMGYGYGYPLFNFYPPGPYYIGEFFRLFGLAFVDIVKILGVLGFVLAAVFMYLLTREFWGRRGGIISALFYTYTPYHSVDLYVRGAVNEFWSLVFFPAILWSTFKLIKHRSPGYLPLVSLSVAGLMLSHNPMLMIFTPVIIIWVIFWWIRFSSLRSLPYLTVSAVWAAGLAAFFTLPVLLEQKYAHVESLVIGYFNYLAHYIDLNQIFFRINWGYGPSVLGPDDGLSFALGYLHWIIPALILVCLPLNKSLRRHFPLILFCVAGILGSLFLAHSKSTWIWQHLSVLSYLQFPWRFLTLSIFFAGFLAGAAALFLPRKLVPVLLSLLLLLNVQYFHPQSWLPDMTDAKKFSGSSWQALITASIFDYLPIYAPLPPADRAGSDLVFTKGTGSFSRVAKKSNLQTYNVRVASSSAVIELQTYYFPGWQIRVDNRPVPVDPRADKLLGRMQISLTPGDHQVVARFTPTPVRRIADIISGISWFSLLLFAFLAYARNTYRRHRYTGI